VAGKPRFIRGEICRSDGINPDSQVADIVDRWMNRHASLQQTLVALKFPDVLERAYKLAPALDCGLHNRKVLFRHAD
jgi:hypothetical protein